MSKNENLSFLELFKKEEARIRVQTMAQEKEAKGKLIESEKKLNQVRAKLPKEREILAQMKSDYSMALNELERKMRSEIEEKSMTKSDLNSGRVTIRKFLENGGKVEEDIQKMALKEAKSKLNDMMAVIREKTLAIWSLELEEKREEENIYHLSTYPATCLMKRLEAQTKSLEQRLSAVLQGWPKCRAEKEAIANRIKLAKNQALSGHIWHSLSEEELKELRFDPRIPTEYLDDLEKIIQKIEETGKTINLKLGIRSDWSEPGLSYWEEGKKATTSNIKS